MIEKNSDYKIYQKKMTGYIDGSLSPAETSEFEAFVMTHPDFEVEIKKKKQEIDLLKNMIPVAELSSEAQDALEEEMKSSIFNLLDEKAEGFFDSIRIKWEDKFNR